MIISDAHLINVTMEVWGIIFSFIAFWTILGYQQRKDIFWFSADEWKGLLLVHALALFSDIMASSLDGDPTVWGYYLLRVSNFSEYILNFLMSLMFASLCARLLDEEECEKFMRAFWIIFWIYAVMIVTNLFSGSVYYFDSLNYYHRGPLFVPSQVMALLIEFGEFYLLVKYRRKVSKDMFRSFMLFILLPIVALVGQTWIYGLSIIYWATTISLIVMFIVMQQDMTKLMLDQEHQLSQNKIQSMLSQLHPHFLYNALMAIMAIEGTPPKTKTAISDFGKYLRCNLDSLEDSGMIDFEKELHHIETYVKLEKLRFEDKLEVVYHIGERNFKVPALCVQMMVENAIKHGITKKKGEGKVVLTVREGMACYEIIVEDNGIGFDPMEEPDDSRVHVGITNTRERLKLLADGDLKITSTKGVGTKVLITIPMAEEVY